MGIATLYALVSGAERQSGCRLSDFVQHVYFARLYFQCRNRFVLPVPISYIGGNRGAN